MLLRGIDGIVVPRVDDEATARAVVETVRYVLPAAHSRTSVIVQIESREALHALIRGLAIPDAEKQRLLALTPATYIGKAAELAKRL